MKSVFFFLDFVSSVVVFAMGFNLGGVFWHLMVVFYWCFWVFRLYMAPLFVMFHC